MLRAMGVTIQNDVDGAIRLTPPAQLTACDVQVPTDISSAAFFMVAASIVPNSEITLHGVGMNPTRTGILEVLLAMGANITQSNYHDDVEPICDLTIRSAQLHGTHIDGAIIPRLIDELPVLAVAADCAHGQTIIADAAELKVKESNRIAAMCTELTRAGATVQETADGMIINGGASLHGATFRSYNDHRIAMSMAVCALVCDGESAIDDPAAVAISYPNFFAHLAQLGG